MSAAGLLGPDLVHGTVMESAHPCDVSAPFESRSSAPPRRGAAENAKKEWKRIDHITYERGAPSLNSGQVEKRLGKETRGKFS